MNHPNFTTRLLRLTVLAIATFTALTSVSAVGQALPPQPKAVPSDFITDYFESG